MQHIAQRNSILLFSPSNLSASPHASRLLSAVLLASERQRSEEFGDKNVETPDVMLCVVPPGAGESRTAEQDQDCRRWQEAEVKLAPSQRPLNTIKKVLFKIKYH